jgi:hypothetical protein
VRLEITRFEIRASDIYTLSGQKQGGKTVQQFRALNYEPTWTPNVNSIILNDAVVYNGTMDDIGYWRVRNNDGGLIFRVPNGAEDMPIGSIFVYAKNTGPYPYASMGAQAYQQYQDVYDDDHGGEVLLFMGFTSVADVHWKLETEHPHFFDVRLPIFAGGLFNNFDRRDFAFEAVVDILTVNTEKELDDPIAKAYGAAIIEHHSRTGLPAIAYRNLGAARWFAYPLHDNYQAPREELLPLADAVLDDGLLDYGTIAPPPITINNVEQGVVITGQPRQTSLPTLTFTKKDVASWTATTTPVTVSVLPNTDQQYLCSIKVADLALLGGDQQLFLIHNTTRYNLLRRGVKRNTPPIVIRHGDTLQLEGTLQGPISSLTGYIYAELNEAPVSADVDNKPTWLIGKVNMHISCTVPTTPDKLDFGLMARRISGYTWDEYSPEQRITGLGYDIYGEPQELAITIRVKPSLGGSGGIGYTFGNQASPGAASYLPADYVDPDGKTVIRRGVSGLANTYLKVYKNDVDMGSIATPLTPESFVTFTVKENDIISFRARLDGRAASYNMSEVLPAISLGVEGVTSFGTKFLQGVFDLAATFGPDTTPQSKGSLPTIAYPGALTNSIGLHSFGDMANNYLINRSVVTVPSSGSPYTMTGDWLTLMASPNPTINAATSLEIMGLVVTGTATNGFSIQLEKFGPWAAAVTFSLATQAGVVTPVNIGNVAPADTFRIKATFSDPDVRVQLVVRVTTENSVKDLLVDCTVRSV